MEQQPELAVRERLLEAAIGLFARKGYHATSVREIVEAAGVTKPVLYYWFQSKEGIFHALMALAVEAHQEVVARVRAHEGSAAERIVLLGEGVMGLVKANAEVVRVFDSVYYGPREGAPDIDFDPLHGEFRRFLTSLVEEGVRTGESTTAIPGHDVGAARRLHGLRQRGGLVRRRRSGLRACDDVVTDVRRVMNIVLDGMRNSERKQ